jgi:glucose-1-phosphate thymidylyltransferase
MKGILLSGGLGTRLAPITRAITKQLLPIYDKPIIYYSLATLMLAGLREILLITTEQDLDRYKALLGDGKKWGISISYAIQPKPEGIAQAFLIAEEFLSGEPCALILGDNIFFGQGFAQVLQEAARLRSGGLAFAYRVRDPERYGVLEFDRQSKIIGIQEKPQSPPSDWAVTGLYFYDSRVCEYARALKPSARGELEITDLNKVYLAAGKLSVEFLGRGYTWFDTGTQDALVDAAHFVQAIFHRQGLRISCVEEVAFRMGYIDREALIRLGNELMPSEYGQYLIDIARETLRAGLSPFVAREDL